MADQEGMGKAACDREVLSLLSNPRGPRAIMDNLTKYKRSRVEVNCLNCEEVFGLPNVRATFHPDQNLIYLCFNMLTDKEDLKVALKHELIHAFDKAGGAEFDFDGNLAAIACSELRAAKHAECSNYWLPNRRKECTLAVAREAMKFQGERHPDQLLEKLIDPCYTSDEELRALMKW